LRLSVLRRLPPGTGWEAECLGFTIFCATSSRLGAPLRIPLGRDALDEPKECLAWLPEGVGLAAPAERPLPDNLGLLADLEGLAGFLAFRFLGAETSSVGVSESSES
jgi:hypothetical protein